VALRDKNFFKRLGERVAELRQDAEMTQAQLGEILGCSQQQVVSFEKARVRIPANLLPVLAQTFGVTLEDLLGVRLKTPKRGPVSKIEQQLRQLSELPRSKQRFVTEMLDTVLQQAS